MDDLISRKAAIDDLERYRELFSWDDGDRERAILSRVIKELQSMPTAEKRGKWVTTDDKYIDVSKCSECGAVEYFNKGWKRFNFCPNCGARMEE